MIKRTAFTLLELIFVIVIMGILSKFGVEYLYQAYNTFIYAKINNELQSRSELAVQTIANRLQYRIPQSTIKRIRTSTTFTLAPQIVANPNEYNVLEWIGYDIDGFRGSATEPLWSGIIDLNTTLTTSAKLFSPDTNTSAVNALIQILSEGGATIADAAIFFAGADYDKDGFGWYDGITAITDHTKSIHPINANSNIDEFATGFGSGDFSGMRVYNRYSLAWSAYALAHEGTQLFLYYNYQPWHGEKYSDYPNNNIKKSLLMDNVDTFRIRPSPDGTLFNIIVCVENNLTVEGTHSLCKEKVIF